MDIVAYYQSISAELGALKNRVRNFLSDPHWLTDGEWKESVLRAMLRRNLPHDIYVGRGAVISENANSPQIDLMIYSGDRPVLFRDGDLAFLTSDTVLGIVEVKSRLDQAHKLKEALAQLSRQAGFIRSEGGELRFTGLFVYESKLMAASSLQAIQSVSNDTGVVVDLICLGDNHFIRWEADSSDSLSGMWKAYKFHRRAPGYFLHNIVEVISPHSVGKNKRVWFPPEGKEYSLVASITKDGDLKVHKAGPLD